MTPTPIAPLLTYQQAAEVLGMHVVSVRRLVSEGRITHIKIGRMVRFRADVLNKWLDRHTHRAIA